MSESNEADSASPKPDNQVLNIICRIALETDRRGVEGEHLYSAPGISGVVESKGRLRGEQALHEDGYVPAHRAKGLHIAVLMQHLHNSQPTFDSTTPRSLGAAARSSISTPRRSVSRAIRQMILRTWLSASVRPNPPRCSRSCVPLFEHSGEPCRVRSDVDHRHGGLLLQSANEVEEESRRRLAPLRNRVDSVAPQAERPRAQPRTPAPVVESDQWSSAPAPAALPTQGSNRSHMSAARPGLAEVISGRRRRRRRERASWSGGARARSRPCLGRRRRGLLLSDCFASKTAYTLSAGTTVCPW